MRQVFLRFAVLCMVALGLGHCSPDSVVLLIHVNNLTPDINALKVSAVLDGKPASQNAEFTQQLGQVAIKLPRDAIGQGQLTVNLFGLAADRCKLSAVRYDMQVSAEVAYAEIDLSLALLPSKVCTLTVDKVGDGSVNSNPLGIDCGARCTVDLLPGTKVTLTAAAPFENASWEGDCSGTEESCEVTMTQERRVGVQWIPEVRPKLIRVAKGSFMMGSAAASEPERGTNEVQHLVTLTTDFGMSETEVTQRQYRNLMGSNSSSFMGDELPVREVSWLDAVTYCNALSLKEKLTPCYQIAGTDVVWKDGVKCVGYRLPTEAEWEYAARVPTDQKYAGSGNVDAVAWYASNAGNTRHAVKTRQGNGRGLYDLSGNVWEWVWDWYLANYETLAPVDPIGPPSGAYRVSRGGSWDTPASSARVAIRRTASPVFLYSNVGFRLARSYP